MEPKQVDEEPKVDSELTKQIVGQLRQKPYNRVAAYLAAHDVIQRQFEPASYLLGTGRVEASWNIDRPERAMAIAVYIFEEETVEKPNCRQCSKRIGPTPVPVCLCPSGDVVDGACTNCFYSGRPSACSLVLDARRDEKEKERREEEERRMEEERRTEKEGRTEGEGRTAEEGEKEEEVQALTPALLDQMSFAELEVLKHMVDDALGRRRNLGRNRHRVGGRKHRSA